METFAERFDIASARRERFTPTVVALQDHGHWSGLRLEQWEGESQELPETVLFQHALAVNLDTPVSTEVRWSGHRPISQTFAPGTFALFPAGVPYSSRSQGFWRGLIIGIAPEFLQSVAPLAGGRPVEIVPRFGQNDPFVWHATQALARDVREGHPCGRLYGEAVVVALAAHLVRHYSSADRVKEDNGASAYQRRERLREFIFDQLDQPLSLIDLAAVVQMDVHSFAKWFKLAFGSPPHQYVLNARIRRARELLATSSESVVQIALNCGFSSHSHLTTTFRRFVGVSPKAYRLGTRSTI